MLRKIEVSGFLGTIPSSLVRTGSVIEEKGQTDGLDRPTMFLSAVLHFIVGVFTYTFIFSMPFSLLLFRIKSRLNYVATAPKAFGLSESANSSAAVIHL